MTWLDFPRTPGRWDDVPVSPTPAEALAQAMQAKAPPYQPYSSRDEVEGSVVPAPVQYITVNGLDYVRDDNGTALVTGGGDTWSPLGDPTPLHWGARRDGVTDDQPAFQGMIDWAASRPQQFFCFRVPSGEYRVEDEVSFAAMTNRFDVVGGGWRSTRIMATSFGADKAVLVFPGSMFCRVKGLMVGKVGGVGARTDPMGIFAPLNSQVDFDQVFVSALWNTGIFTTRPFNADWSKIEIASTGFTPIFRTADRVLDRLSIDGDVATNARAIFDADCVGKSIIFYAGTDNSAYSRTITDVLSPTQVAFSGQMPVPAPISNVIWSFTGPTVAVTAGSSLITADWGCFDPVDVGRMMYVERGKSNGETWIGRITEYVSPTQVRLEGTTDINSGNAALYFSAGCAISGYQSGGSTPINDICINQMRIEGWKGVALVVSRGTHIQFNNLKTHGRSFNDLTNPGQSGQSLIWDGTTRGFINGWEHEFGAPSQRSGGVISIAGVDPGLTITGMTCNASCYGDQLIYYNPGTPEASKLTINDPETAAYLERFANRFAWAPDSTRRARIFLNGWISARTGEMDAQMPMPLGSASAVPVRTIAPGAVFSFRPATQSAAFFVGDYQSNARSAIVVARAWSNNPPLPIHLGALTTITKDNPGTMNIYCEAGRLCVQNLVVLGAGPDPDTSIRVNIGSLG
ncbi:MAG: hypothetical protein ACK4NW_02020 [Roseinatronobacter sp.]